MKLEFSFDNVSYNAVKEDDNKETGTFKQLNVTVDIKPEELERLRKAICIEEKTKVKCRRVKRIVNQTEEIESNEFTIMLDNTSEIEKCVTITYNNLEYQVYTKKQDIIKDVANGIITSDELKDFVSEAKVTLIDNNTGNTFRLTRSGIRELLSRLADPSNQKILI